MNFEPSAVARDHLERLHAFMEECVHPAEAEYAEDRLARGPHDHTVPPVVEELKTEARSRGLWNLFLPAISGLSHVDYAQLAEVMGRSPVLAPEACNCAAPDTGNMELLHLFATEEQRQRWLQPLMDGSIRSAFAMTEPDVASSDATNVATRIERDGDEYVLHGCKWWISGAADERCQLFIVLGQTNPTAERHQRHSMILVSRGTAGMTIGRSQPVFGFQDQPGHCEVSFDGARLPASNLLGTDGGGFAMAQARLGPGRVHHAMRTIGMAERALELMCRRANDRIAFGRPLAEQGVVRRTVAECRLAIDQVRQLVLRTAWLLDYGDASSARHEIAEIKIAAPRVAVMVLDEAIQLHGAAGLGDTTPLAGLWAHARSLRIADGPDAVHLDQLGRWELRRWA